MEEILPPQTEHGAGFERTRLPQFTVFLENRVGRLTALLRALGNDQRLLILCHLAEGELSVGALHQRLDLSQSALSQHLAKLRDGDLVQTRREGQLIHYSLPDGPVRALMATLHQLYCPE